jgi:ribosomal protein L34E
MILVNDDSLPSCIFTHVLEYYISGLFCSHVDRTCNKKSRNAREDRSVDDTQPLRSVDTEIAGKNTKFVERPYGAA